MGIFKKDPPTPIKKVPVFVGTHQLDTISIESLSYIKTKDIRITVTVTGWEFEEYRNEQISRAATIKSLGLKPLIVIHSGSEFWAYKDFINNFKNIYNLFGPFAWYQIGNENDVEENNGFAYYTPVQYSTLLFEALKITSNIVMLGMGRAVDSMWATEFFKYSPFYKGPICKNLYGEPLDDGLRRSYLSRPISRPIWLTETGSVHDWKFTKQLIEYNDRSHQAEKIYLYQLIEYDQEGDLGIFTKTGVPTPLANYLHER